MWAGWVGVGAMCLGLVASQEARAPPTRKSKLPGTASRTRRPKPRRPPNDRTGLPLAIESQLKGKGDASLRGLADRSVRPLLLGQGIQPRQIIGWARRHATSHLPQHVSLGQKRISRARRRGVRATAPRPSDRSDRHPDLDGRQDLATRYWDKAALRRTLNRHQPVEVQSRLAKEERPAGPGLASTPA